MNEVKLFEKNRTQIKEIFELDDSSIDMLAFEASRIEVLSKIIKYPFLTHGLLALLSNIIYSIKGLKRNLRISNGDFVFISCPDSVFRTKTIDLIAGGLNYCLIYLPNFHINAALKYHKYFKSKGIKTFFPTIHLSYVLKAHRKVRSFTQIMDGFDKSIDCVKMLFVLSHYAIYDEVVKTYMNQIKDFKGKWVLEHDKYYFLASVIDLHKERKACTMLQHGVFFRVSANYIPLFCDRVLCCSEREKRIYIENGVDASRITVFGAPLQTLQLSQENRVSCNEQYDLLLLMTEVKDINKEIMQKVLFRVKKEYNNVLVRMRPRSRINDENMLSEALQGMTISPAGTTISNDIIRCRKVISFSEDANVEVVKFNKPFVYIWTEGERDLESMGNCGTEDNFEKEIRKLMTQDNYSTFGSDKYKEILGENDVRELRKNFHNYINTYPI